MASMDTFRSTLTRLLDSSMLDKHRDSRGSGQISYMAAVKAQKRSLFGVFVASCCIQVLSVTTALAFQLVIDRAMSPDGQHTLVLVASGLAFVSVLSFFIKQFRTYTLNRAAERIDVELGSQVIAKLFSLPMRYFDSRSAGYIISQIRELETVRLFLTGQSVIAAIDILFTMIFLTILFFYSVTLALIITAFLPLYAVTPILIKPALVRLVKAKLDHWSSSQQLVLESVVGAATIKSAAIEPHILAEWNTRFSLYTRAGFDSLIMAATSQNTVEMLAKIAAAAVLFFGAREVLAGRMTTGGLIAFYMIASQMLQPVLRIAQLWQDYHRFRISVGRIGELFNEASDIRPDCTVVPRSTPGDIELKDVFFRYSSTGIQTLSAISLLIPRGEHIGIVGTSGSGKSTLIKLLLKLYEPDQGGIFVDRISIAEIDTDWIRRQISVVFQDDCLFNGSIRENIALGTPSMTLSEVIRASKLAGVDQFVCKLPSGYDTRLADRGSNLSAGQRQRIAIARALARNPRILIFDEATSALDYESEQIIQANMIDIMKDRTVITVAHRLTAVRHCSRIVGMKNGMIVECGSHEELLLRSGGVYGDLWNRQRTSDRRNDL